MKKAYKRGWYGDSTGHALAARGIRRYNKGKQNLVDPRFFAHRQQKELPFNDVMDMVRQKKTYMAMKAEHPNVDPEDVRRRAIKAVEMRDADNTLSKLDRNGVDLTLQMAEQNQFFKVKAQDAVSDAQKRSLLKEEKAQALQEGLARIQ